MNFMVLTKYDNEQDEIMNIIESEFPEMQKGVLFVEESDLAMDYLIERKFADVVIVDSDNYDAHLWHRIKYFIPTIQIIYYTKHITKDYLDLEPYRVVSNMEQLRDAIHRALLRKHRMSPKLFRYHKNRDIKTVEMDKIMYFWSDKRKRYFKLMDGTTDYFYEDMDTLERKLLPFGFERVSKSYIISLDHVLDYQNDYFIMEDGSNVKMTIKKRIKK